MTYEVYLTHTFKKCLKMNEIDRLLKNLSDELEAF